MGYFILSQPVQSANIGIHSAWRKERRWLCALTTYHCVHGSHSTSGVSPTKKNNKLRLVCVVWQHNMQHASWAHTHTYRVHKKLVTFGPTYDLSPQRDQSVHHSTAAVRRKIQTHNSKIQVLRYLLTSFIFLSQLVVKYVHSISSTELQPTDTQTKGMFTLSHPSSHLIWLELPCSDQMWQDQLTSNVLEHLTRHG